MGTKLSIQLEDSERGGQTVETSTEDFEKHDQPDVASWR